MKAANHQVQDAKTFIVLANVSRKIARGVFLAGLERNFIRIEGAPLVIALQPQPPDHVVGGFATGATKALTACAFGGNVKAAMQAIMAAGWASMIARTAVSVAAAAAPLSPWARSAAATRTIPAAMEKAMADWGLGFAARSWSR